MLELPATKPVGSLTVRSYGPRSLVAWLLPAAFVLHEIGYMLARSSCGADARLSASVAIGVAIVLGTAWPFAPRLSRVLFKAVAALVSPAWARASLRQHRAGQQRRVYSFGCGSGPAATPLAFRLAGRSPPATVDA